MKYFITVIALLMQYHTYANSEVHHVEKKQNIINKDYPSVITLGQIKSSNKAKSSNIQQQVLDFLTPIYKRLGIQLRTSIYPAKRSLAFSNRGQLDGELLRIYDINNTYSDLVAVPITLYEINAYAYTINGRTNLKQASDILRFRVGINRGIEWEENFVDQFPHHVSRVDGTKRKFKFLTLGRVDYIISNEQRANDVIAQDFPNKNIKRVLPMLPKVNLIHYLHKKHAHIIPKLIEEIKKQQDKLPLTLGN